jgi:hypothetical protein
MAEVKVKITAANQTQTGFQSVLADAQKTATQVQQTFARASTAPRIPQVKQPGGSGGPIDIDIGDYGLGPLRELQEQLKKAREASKQAFDPEPTEQYGNGIGGVLGRFALLIGAAATVGKIVAAAFDQLSEAVKSAIGIQEQFNRTLQQAGQATSLEGAISEFGRLQASAEQTGKIVKETFGRNIGESIANLFSGRPGQIMARAADLLTGGAVRGEITAQEEQQRRIARDTTRGNLARLSLEEDERAATGGDSKALERLEREQRKRRELDNLRSSIQNESPQVQAAFENELKALQAQRDQNEAARERFQTEQEVSKEKEKQAAASAREAEQSAKRLAAEQERIAKARRGIDQDIALTEAKLRGDKGAEEDILQQRDIDRAMEGGATFEQAANLAATNALQRQTEAASAAEGQAKMTGSFGASQLQRIGFASNEFFDTRRKEDPSKLMQQMVSEQKKTNKYLGDADGLYLQPSS